MILLRFLVRINNLVVQLWFVEISLGETRRGLQTYHRQLFMNKVHFL